MPHILGNVAFGAWHLDMPEGSPPEGSRMGVRIETHLLLPMPKYCYWTANPYFVVICYPTPTLETSNSGDGVFGVATATTRLSTSLARLPVTVVRLYEHCVDRDPDKR